MQNERENKVIQKAEVLSYGIVISSENFGRMFITNEKLVQMFADRNKMGFYK